MEVGSNGSAVKRYVLRKKPPGELLASAHAVEREFLVCIFLIFHWIFIILYLSNSSYEIGL